MGAHSLLTLLFCLLPFLAFTAGSVSSSDSSIDAIIPPSLIVPAGNEVQQMLFGVGVQIYSYNGSAWVQQNVSADLYDLTGQKVGHHFYLSQPDSNGGLATWEIFFPSSRVSGKPLVSVPSPFPISGVPKDSINWLLVQATSHTGRAKFVGSTTYVQRIFTHGGLAPSSPGAIGSVFESNYTALYKYSI